MIIEGSILGGVCHFCNNPDYKLCNTILYNFYSIPLNQSQYYNHFGTDCWGSTLLLRLLMPIVIIIISAMLIKLVTTSCKLCSSITGARLALHKLSNCNLSHFA